MNYNAVKKFLFLFGLLSSSLFAQKENPVDSLLATMTLREKIGQLFMIPLAAQGNVNTLVSEKKLNDIAPGGIYITKGTPQSHAKLANHAQRLSKLPLFFGLNAEWGLAQTLDSGFAFPMPLTIGASTHDSLVYQMGIELAKQMRAIGAHLNFGLHADVDVPNGSLVANRYFGTNPKRVASKLRALNAGLWSGGVIPIAKHLPGINPEMSRREAKLVYNLKADTTSFYPFEVLIKDKVGGLLTSHMHFGSDDGRSIPAPVSEIFVTDFLTHQYGFQGLAIADIGYLKSIVGKRKGKAEKVAFEAGNNMLLNPQHIPKTIKALERSVRGNKKMEAHLNASVRKILAAKWLLGLFSQRQVPIPRTGFFADGPAASAALNIAKDAVTLVKNGANTLPITTLDNRKFRLLKIGQPPAELDKMIARFVPIEIITLGDLRDTVSVSETNSNDITILSLGPNRPHWWPWVNRKAVSSNWIVAHSGSPFELAHLQGVTTLIEGYEPATAGPLAELMFGSITPTGKLPVFVTPNLMEGTGVTFGHLQRLEYATPEAAGMDGTILAQLDTVVAEALRIQATPGVRIMIARKGKVVYNKSYGHQNNTNQLPVSENTIYDLASVTKIAATLQAVMFMHERGLIDIHKKISLYLPEFENSNKRDMIIKDILTHQAGLWPFFPWHFNTMKDSTWMPEYYANQKSSDYPFPVSENLFAHKSMRDSMWQWIIKSKTIEKKDRTPYEYRYSDLGLYIMQRLAERILQQPLEDFVAQNFYEPMGAVSMGYRPLERFKPNQIASTENDKVFRKSLLTGHVHDPGAAMHGGVAGHAGLFSNANDLLKMGQMWLQKGFYGGHQYLKPETLDLFTTRTYQTSRRGLGFDKPTGDNTGSTGELCSPLTFGHTGFTGTCIWVDPKYEVVYVFLSNRVNPAVSPKLLTNNIRTRIHDIIYKSIEAGNKKALE